MYEMTVGLETHIELSTKSKLFCSCKNSFGMEANSACCPVCLGLPGSLPVLNRQAVRFAVMAGIGLNCQISPSSVMARKNYMYPDLPKAYQITQGDYPICREGFMMLSDGKKIRIKRLHIEEDAGKLIHQKEKTYADYNRCGVPLIEIVTEPDFTSAEQVREYVEKLRLVMRTLGISNCRMQEGSLRCDVNISVKKTGENFSEKRIEIKNINSVSFMAKAINYEFKRQKNVLKKGGELNCETRGFNEKTGETFLMREKETAADYRYFPEPDIPPVLICKEEIEEIKQMLPELPEAKKDRLVKFYNVSEKDAEWLIKYPKAVEYYESLVRLSGEKEFSLKLLLNHIFALVKDETSREEARFPKAEYIAEVISLFSSGAIKKGDIQRIIEKIILENKSFSELFDINEFTELSDDETEALCKAALEENQEAVKAFLGGKEKALFAIVGTVMKKSCGKASAEKAKEIILRLINKI